MDVYLKITLCLGSLTSSATQVNTTINQFFSGGFSIIVKQIPKIWKQIKAVIPDLANVRELSTKDAYSLGQQ